METQSETRACQHEGTVIFVEPRKLLQCIFWPQAASALLAGGGMRTGQVIGSTDAHASEPKDRPVHYREVFATLYQNLGIPPSSLVLQDRDGRPHQIVGGAKPIGELL